MHPSCTFLPVRKNSRYFYKGASHCVCVMRTHTFHAFLTLGTFHTFLGLRVCKNEQAFYEFFFFDSQDSYVFLEIHKHPTHFLRHKTLKVFLEVQKSPTNFKASAHLRRTSRGWASLLLNSKGYGGFLRISSGCAAVHTVSTPGDSWSMRGTELLRWGNVLPFQPPSYKVPEAQYFPKRKSNGLL